MSHYTVTVVLPEAPKNANHVNEMLNRILAPFDENVQVEPYRDHIKPAPADWRTTDINRIPWPYSVVREHDRDIDLGDNEAVAAFLNKRYAPDEEYFVDEQGLYTMSTYNPESKWDWWSIGGRWAGFYTLTNGRNADMARKGDILPAESDGGHQTYAVIDAEGKWHGKGRMGWWAISTNEVDDFDEQFQKFWSELSDDTWVVVLDLHI